MLQRQILRLAIVVVAVVGLAGVARAKRVKQYKYVGSHPLGDGYCYIAAPHVHIVAPGNKKRVALEYRVYEDHYHFVGDPVARGYDGDTVGYYGHHPIALDVVAGAHVDGAPHTVVYCYLNGPHFHAYAPAPDLQFETKGGVYWYVGTYPREYEEEKPELVRINPLYARVEYERPVVEVEPPVAYVGPIVEVHAPAVVVDAPPARAEVSAGVEVDVHIPAPSLHLDVGVPGVIVVDDDHHHGERRYRKHHHKREKRVYRREHRRKRSHKIEKIWKH